MHLRYHCPKRMRRKRPWRSRSRLVILLTQYARSGPRYLEDIVGKAEMALKESRLPTNVLCQPLVHGVGHKPVYIPVA